MALDRKKFFNFKFLGAAAAAATVGLSSVAVAQSDSVISIDGSSTVFPITEAVAEEFSSVAPDIDITVGVSGTGGGFKKFCAGETAISNASRPIKDSEKELCAANGIDYEFVDVARDAITVVIHKDNTWADQLTADQLTKIWGANSEGSITRWNQVDSSFPDAPLNLYGPGSDSGTFDYFNEALLEDVGGSRGDYTASEDDNILVRGVSRDVNALGYFGLAYYGENDTVLDAVSIASEETEGVFASPTGDITKYKPLSREIFIYVNTNALAARPEVESFVEFYLENAGRLAGDVGYVALSDAEYEAQMDKLF
ncbi:MAG: PstS family phosphate ABC transporter substrate-binding protein [Cyanobacteria bacterium P01_D01_bin.105]